MNINYCHGLILTGGYSSRMGMDKCMIAYHGIPQFEYVQQLLSPVCSQVFLSCRQGQEINTSIPIIFDSIADIGPMSGLLAAFNKHNNIAWLVMACDMPLVDDDVIQELIGQRDAVKQATYFIDPETSMPEPLLAIYEPLILPVLGEHADRQQYSLNKLLRSCDGNAVIPSVMEKLISVNTREEMISALKKIRE